MNENAIRTLPIVDISARDLVLAAEMHRLAAEGDPRVLPARRPLRTLIGRIPSTNRASSIRGERTAEA